MHSPGRRPGRRAFAPLAAVMMLVMLGRGCATPPTPSPLLRTPYEQKQVWAVAPLANESGVSKVDTARLADALARQVQQVQGLDALPVNRVIAAMRSLNMPAITSTADADALMIVLDLDGLIVGTVTAYDPYSPPVLGAAVQLHLRPRRIAANFDLQTLVRATAGEPSPGEMARRNPVSHTAGIFDARHQQTRLWLAEFAANRSQPDSAYGPDIYLVSMDLYTQFVSYRLMRDLLEAEQARIGPTAYAVAPP
jgi:hypothetical protein